MIKFMAKRLFGAILLLLVFSFFVFVMIDFSTGNIVAGLYGDNIAALNPHTKERILANLGLDRPLLQRYLDWFLNFIHGDFGISFVSGQKVSTILLERLPYTLILGGFAFLISFLLSITLGSLSAIYHKGFIDKTIVLFTLVFYSMPSFWIGLVFIMIFSVYLELFPSSGVYDFGMEGNWLNLTHHMILPVMTLSVGHLAIYVRLVRNSILEGLNQPFVSSFKSWGVSQRQIFFRLVLRYSVIPIISYFGANSATIITGTYIIETLFSIGGIGNLAISSLLAKDYPVALMIILLSTVFVVLANLCVEILTKLINPKLK